MPVSRALATWEGSLAKGKGTMTVESKTFEAPFDAKQRFGDKPGLNPEELLGAAYAGCFSQALANTLSQDGHIPKHISTSAQVTMDEIPDGFEIGEIRLNTTVDVEDMDQDQLTSIANEVKSACPVGKALAAVKVSLDVTLAESES